MNAISLHPVKELVVSASADHSLAFFDIEKGQLLSHVKDLGAPVTLFEAHPNGKAGFTAVGGKVMIFDLMEHKMTRWVCFDVGKRNGA